MKTIALTLIAACCLLTATSCLEPYRDAQTKQPVYGFHTDYQIDLKQDGYIIIDETGDQHRVELGKLEEFFLQDNL